MTDQRPRFLRRLVRAKLGTAGSVAVELALLSPLLVFLMIGIVDLGMYFNYAQALAAATRIGAEAALYSPECQSGINTLASPPTISSACTTKIKNTVTSSMNYGVGALTFPASFPLSCECERADPPSIYQPCAGSSNFDSCFANPPAPGFTGPNRIFITVSANQSFTPMISWPWPVPRSRPIWPR